MHIMYQYDTKRELREALRDQTIRDVIVAGNIADTHRIELRFDDNSSLVIHATNYGTLKIEG